MVNPRRTATPELCRWVCAANSGSSATIETSSGAAHAADINGAAASVNLVINVNVLTNVIQDPQGAPRPLQGKNFTSSCRSTTSPIGKLCAPRVPRACSGQRRTLTK
jgi:hypothetical protein